MRRATLSGKLRKREGPKRTAGKGANSVLISAIEEKAVLSFVYEGQPRTVEPQTYGISTAGEPVLRARQVGGGSRSGQQQIAKLFQLARISALRKTGAHFEEALPQHNPNDSAMITIFASLPRPAARKAVRQTVGALSARTRSSVSKSLTAT